MTKTYHINFIVGMDGVQYTSNVTNLKELIALSNYLEEVVEGSVEVAINRPDISSEDDVKAALEYIKDD